MGSSSDAELRRVLLGELVDALVQGCTVRLLLLQTAGAALLEEAGEQVVDRGPAPGAFAVHLVLLEEQAAGAEEAAAGEVVGDIEGFVVDVLRELLAADLLVAFRL